MLTAYIFFHLAGQMITGKGDFAYPPVLGFGLSSDDAIIGGIIAIFIIIGAGILFTEIAKRAAKIAVVSRAASFVSMATSWLFMGATIYTVYRVFFCYAMAFKSIFLG